jgi:hypothetical protein
MKIRKSSSGIYARSASAALALVWLSIAAAQSGVGGKTTELAISAPDWSGVWQATDPQALLKPIDQEAIPFKTKARALYEDKLRRRARGDVRFDLTAKRCSSPGIPRILFLPYPFEIVSSPGQIVFAYEFNHVYRQVFIGGPAPSPLYPTTMGLAIGRWEGPKLTIETSARSTNTLLDDAIANSDQLKISEHLSREGDTIEDRVTIDDPAVFVRPWTAVVHFQKIFDRDIIEDVCLDRLSKGHHAIEWPRNK